MSDLTEMQSSQSVKIAGANPATGAEDNYIDVDTAGNAFVRNTPIDGQRITYSAAAVGLVPAASATDIFTIVGNSTKIIRVTRVEISGTTAAGSGASMNCTLVKRSAVNSGGTSTTCAQVPHDSTSAAASAIVTAYTSNPASLGTLVGAVRSTRFDLPQVGGVGGPLLWTFGDRPSQALVIRGVFVLSINLNGATITNPVLDISIEWTEE
jgi:hypothetical protein